MRLSPADPFWQWPLGRLWAGLCATADGLAARDAASRRTVFGANVLRGAPRGAFVRLFASRFGNPLVIVLLVASGIAAATGDRVSFLIISLIVLMSVLLDTLQEHRAGRAAERLRRSVAVHATVRRDGVWADHPLADVVPGDIVRLAAGDAVPADARVLTARDFFVNQALLTGESYPVEKRPGDVAAGAGLDGADNAVFMGTSIISGRATALICRTGESTALGAIAESLIAKAPPTSFERGTRRFGMLIMRLTVLLALGVLFINTMSGRPLLEAFLFAVALAVGLTPELLPMIVSVTLSRGALRMAAKQVIVKRLASVQNLGSMDVLCTDKTGTLTQACIRLERHIDARGQSSERVLQLAYLNSLFETGLKSPLDDAILAYQEIDVRGVRKVDEVPFDFERRRVSVLLERDGERLLVLKGAPEDVLERSAAVETDGAVGPLAAAGRAGVAALYHALGLQGLRVLGIAWRRFPPEQVRVAANDEADLVFAGLLAFVDPPKETASGAVAGLRRSGVSIKIVTGDNELVTRHVCAQIGLPVSRTLNGADAANMDDFALQAVADETTLFCRMTPVQKNRVILALKARGHVVGFLGDGINDAPSLHAADIGISVDGAVDVAKEAADMILLAQDLNVLYEGIREGRRSFGNVLKYIMMATSSNFGNMFSMAAATLVIPFLPMLPVQILLNNFLYDLSEVPIPLDHVDEADLARPHEWDMTAIRNFMMVIGPVSSAFDFLTFYVMLRVFHAHEAMFHTGWFLESVATQVLVIFVIRTRASPLASRPHPLLVVTSLAVVACATLLPWTPAGAALGFVRLPLDFFAILAVMVVAYLGAVEGVKQWFYRHLARA